VCAKYFVISSFLLGSFLYNAPCLVWFGLVWFGLVWFGLVWFGLVWCCDPSTVETTQKRPFDPTMPSSLIKGSIPPHCDEEMDGGERDDKRWIEDETASLHGGYTTMSVFKLVNDKV